MAVKLAAVARTSIQRPHGEDWLKIELAAGKTIKLLVEVDGKIINADDAPEYTAASAEQLASEGRTHEGVYIRVQAQAEGSTQQDVATPGVLKVK